MVRISGNRPPDMQSEADLPVHMQGSASPSDEPICALMESMTSTYSTARVDSLGGDALTNGQGGAARGGQASAGTETHDALSWVLARVPQSYLFQFRATSG